MTVVCVWWTFTLLKTQEKVSRQAAKVDDKHGAALKTEDPEDQGAKIKHPCNPMMLLTYVTWFMICMFWATMCYYWVNVVDWALCVIFEIPQCIKIFDMPNGFQYNGFNDPGRDRWVNKIDSFGFYTDGPDESKEIEGLWIDRLNFRGRWMASIGYNTGTYFTLGPSWPEWMQTNQVEMGWGTLPNTFQFWPDRFVHICACQYRLWPLIVCTTYSAWFIALFFKLNEKNKTFQDNSIKVAGKKTEASGGGAGAGGGGGGGAAAVQTESATQVGFLASLTG